MTHRNARLSGRATAIKLASLAASASQASAVHLITLTGPDGTVQQTTPPSQLAAQILAATKVPAPPRITAITPA